MQKVTETREYAADRKELFDRLTDPAFWPHYYNGMVAAETERFTEAGDVAHFRHRLLGRLMDGEARLLEFDAPNRIRIEAEVKGMPPVEQDWVYEDTEDGGTRIHAVMTTPEVESWFGRTLDRFVMPRQLERDLLRTLDNVEDLLRVGLDAVDD